MGACHSERSAQSRSEQNWPSGPNTGLQNYPITELPNAPFTPSRSPAHGRRPFPRRCRGIYPRRAASYRSPRPFHRRALWRLHAQSLYSLLAASYADFPWARTYFFFGDERHVPPTDPDSNFRMVNESLLSKIAIPAQNVFRVKAENPDAARSRRRLRNQT